MIWLDVAAAITSFGTLIIAALTYCKARVIHKEVKNGNGSN